MESTDRTYGSTSWTIGVIATIAGGALLSVLMTLAGSVQAAIVAGTIAGLAAPIGLPLAAAHQSARNNKRHAFEAAALTETDFNEVRADIDARRAFRGTLAGSYLVVAVVLLPLSILAAAGGGPLGVIGLGGFLFSMGLFTTSTWLWLARRQDSQLLALTPAAA